MNSTVDYGKLGPLDLIYRWADQIFTGTQGLLAGEKVSGFVDSVRWDEPFVRALLLAQIVLFVLTFLTRRYDFVQFGILIALTIGTLSAERLNEYGSKNWSKFASQDYFDGPGLFMLVFVSGPFVVLANFIVVRSFFCN